MDTSLVLIRHAETVWNREGRLQGSQDSPLTDFGVEQARQLGRRLGRRPFDAVHSSDSGRCRETARVALAGAPDPRFDVKLRERNLGAWEGRTWKDILAAFPEAARDYKQDPSFRPPGGESWNELRDRVMSVLNQIVKVYPGQRVAVVTHGGALRAAVFGAMGLPAENWGTWATWNTGLSRMDHRDGQWKLIKYNDVGHLSGTPDSEGVF